MHKVFGEKDNTEYYTRKGAYLIAFSNGKISVVETEKGLFLIGGGIDGAETDEEAIHRECLEETGYSCKIERFVCSAEAYQIHPSIGHFHPVQNYYSGELLGCDVKPTEKDHRIIFADYQQLRGKLFIEMQNWALDMCMKAYY